MEFNLEKVVVRVPTTFVHLNGTRLSLSDFDRTIVQLEDLAGDPIERRYLDRDLDRDWAVEWEKRGVVRTFISAREDDYGSTLHFEMIGKGARYDQFMAAVAVFQTQRRLENAQKAKVTCRSHLKAQLKALDAPALHRPTIIEDKPTLFTNLN